MRRVDLLGVALHAFPRRFRAARADELRSTAADAADAGVDLGARALADVVLAGWRERARTRPPLGAFLAYRFLERPLEPRWHRWVVDDTSGWFGFRRGLWVTTLMLPWFAVSTIGPPSFIAFFVLTPAIGAAMNQRNRLRTLARHGIDPSTLAYAAPPRPLPVWVPPPTVHHRAAPILLVTGSMLTLVAPVAALPMLAPHLVVARMGAMSREGIDHAWLVGTIAAVAGLALALIGSVVACRLELGTVAGPSPHGEQIGSSRPAIVASVAVGHMGLASAVLPIAPLAMPATFVVAGGLGPALVVLGLRARRVEQASGTVVVLRRPCRTAHAAN